MDNQRLLEYSMIVDAFENDSIDYSENSEHMLIFFKIRQDFIQSMSDNCMAVIN